MFRFSVRLQAKDPLPEPLEIPMAISAVALGVIAAREVMSLTRHFPIPVQWFATMMFTESLVMFVDFLSPPGMGKTQRIGIRELT